MLSVWCLQVWLTLTKSLHPALPRYRENPQTGSLIHFLGIPHRRPSDLWPCSFWDSWGTQAFTEETSLEDMLRWYGQDSQVRWLRSLEAAGGASPVTQQSIYSSPPRTPKELKTDSEDSLTHFLCPQMTFPDTGSQWLPWVYIPVSQASPPRSVSWSAA